MLSLRWSVIFQMAAQMPLLLEQMQNPQFQQMLNNPRALQAMMQVQQGMQELQSQAPSVFPGAGLVCLMRIL